jgi:hypothetical protein
MTEAKAFLAMVRSGEKVADFEKHGRAAPASGGAADDGEGTPF